MRFSGVLGAIGGFRRTVTPQQRFDGNGAGAAPPARLAPLAALLAALALAAALALGWFAPGAPGGAGVPTAGAQAAPVDYDADNDGLIEVRSLAQLNAMRHDLDGNGVPVAAGTTTYAAAFPDRITATTSRMGCPAGVCRGYELDNDLDFDVNNDGMVAAPDPYTNWTPIGGLFTTTIPSGSNYSAIFDGNGHTISNLTISRNNHTALFAGLTGTIRNVGMLDSNLSAGGTASVGPLVAIVSSGGVLSAVYAEGGTIALSGTSFAGGLVGSLGGGTIQASYSSGITLSAPTNSGIAGLAGGSTGGSIIASYAANIISTGPVVRGGLVGTVQNSPTVTNSYCDSTVTNINCVGTGTITGSATQVTTANLASPMGYTGIYANWNLDLDGDHFPDNPWRFGTSDQRPTINPPSRRIVDYDQDNDRLIDVSTLHQLNAIRYDLDGNGILSATSVYAAYGKGFVGADIKGTSTRMGCPSGVCVGYELTQDLDFDADGSGSVTSTDPYPNFAPLGNYWAIFDGNGYEIHNMLMNHSDTGYTGLFAELERGSVVRNVGLVDADVTGGAGGSAYQRGTGILAGTAKVGSRVHSSYARGGTVSTAGGSAALGGLLGYVYGQVVACYASAAVQGGSHGDIYAGGLVGAVGISQGNTGEVWFSYSAGTVTSTGSGSDHRIGAFVGYIVNIGGSTGAKVYRSYFDSTVQTGLPGAGRAQGAALNQTAGRATAALQWNREYMGIYNDWRTADVDGDGTADDAWNFGTTTTYPQPQSIEDYDKDDDGLIEITTLDQLNAVRYDLDGDGAPAAGATSTREYGAAFPRRDGATTTRMGCPSGMCEGYELTTGLEFDADNSGAVTSTDPYPHWRPIGGDYAALFEGNGYVLRRMNVDLTVNTSTVRAGLFHILASGATVRNLGFEDATVRAPATGGFGFHGVLAGENHGTILGSWADGGSLTVTGGTGAIAGGLTGRNQGTIRASYATVAVTADSINSAHIGGLVGYSRDGSVIAGSYAAGPVAASGVNTRVGGLLGTSQRAANGGVPSYCSSTTGQTSCVGHHQGTPQTFTAARHTAGELRAPTDYAGIYALWNVDIDGAAGADDPWDFGTGGQLPVLKPGRDYDRDNDGLIDVDSLLLLNALRYDLDGDGHPARALAVAYEGMFPDRIVTDDLLLGCPEGACRGYELTQDLDFDTSGNGSVGAEDDYPTWRAIGPAYTGLFSGDGHRLLNFRISNTATQAGLFHTIGAGGVVQDLGIVNASVSAAGGAEQFVGILAARNQGTIRTSYTRGGSVTITATSTWVGGLVGVNTDGGAILASYSSAAVNAGSTGAVRAGGLVGRQLNAGTINASYAAGAVTASGAGANVAGLVGQVTTNANTVTFTNSYCSAATGQANCRGIVVGAATLTESVARYTAAQMQTPTGYTGIYAQWNIDLDGDTVGDNPWHFGTSSDYPQPNAPADRILDYDEDNDGLIEITTLDQLNAIRWDLNGDGAPSAELLNYRRAFPAHSQEAATLMGCPSGNCAGYELAADLDFDEDGNGVVTSTTPTADRYPNWSPIGVTYTGTFDGNGHTISNMTILQDAGWAGLFRVIGNGGEIRNLGMVNASVNAGGDHTGIVAALIENGAEVNAVYVSGGSISLFRGNARGAGGLVGTVRGTVRASYATAMVDGGVHTQSVVGGLAARVDGGQIIASYAAGAVAATGPSSVRGGFVGTTSGTSTVITNSYCDSEVQAAATPCIGSQTGATVTVEAKTTAELQEPRGYTGIYADWNVSIDDDTVGDNVWGFGSARQYPALYTPAQRTMTFTDYDTDNDGLTEITTEAQLNAIRWDLDGDGAPAPDTAATAAYNAAFTGRDPIIRGMLGYELMANLDFDTNRSGSVTAADAYPNWAPIGGEYAAVFDGNGYTISNLTISSAAGNAGLFNIMASGGVIRDVGIIAPNVSGSSGSYVGALAAFINGGAEISASYVRGGSVNASHSNNSGGGGLAGGNSGTIRASYATASVSGGASALAGGLVGINSGIGTVIASYAASAVTGGAGNAGGLLGRTTGGGNSVIADSYCDATVHGTSTCIGSRVSGSTHTAAAYTTAQLRTPTAYTGIYANWNIDLDGDTYPDNPWNFRAASQYPTPNAAAQRAAVTDYDADNDNLIDIANVYQLNAIRHDLGGDGLPDTTGAYPAYAGAFPGGDLAATGTRMGCASGCAGYELTANLNFDTDRSGSVTAADAFPNWSPIGGSFASTFDGKGHTISNLTINTPSADAALFRILGGSGVIRDVGMIDASVTGGSNAGYAATLVAENAGTVIASYALRGSVATAQNDVFLGGLVGYINNGEVRASYSTAMVSGGSTTGGDLGGLAGNNNLGDIIASYAAGAVSGAGNVGGLLGQTQGTGATIANSYCDTSVHSTTTPCIGNAGTTGLTAAGYTAAQLQTPTGYTGIYVNWNIDLNEDTFADNPWHFGTSSDYPRLNRPDERVFDYDDDNDGLIEVADLDQLNAIRWDLDGNGAPATATAAYMRAFPARDTATTTRMGCPGGVCTGYELAADLDFDADGSGAVTSTDPYPNWTPIGGIYTAGFNGNGHTIRNLTITGGTLNGGLFTIVDSPGSIRDVGMVDPQISSVGSFVGALAGQIRAGATVSASYAQGGVVTSTAATGVGGGLVGRNLGTIQASYATAQVHGGAGASANVGGLAGDSRGTITASYAAGPVQSANASADAGGLVGEVSGSSAAINNSYCDTEVHATTTPCVDGVSGGANANIAFGRAKTTAELQSPTGYTGIYAQWNINIVGDSAGDNPWGFGSARQYPVLYTPAQRAMYPFTSYDADNDGLTEISTLDRLNAIRYDLDGDGSPETGTTAYNAAFAGRDPTIMGMLGYELTQDLNFDTDQSGSVGAGDDYPNWAPIGGTYAGVFDGGGNTISNMTINTAGFAGLFNALGADGVIRDVGLIDAGVSGSGIMMGVLVGNSSGEITASYAQGGSVASTAGLYLGGLVGRNGGTIRASYARVSVDGGAYGSVRVGGLTGFNDVAAIITSYAAGRVSGTAADADLGGLAGQVNSASSTITGSYCDTSVQSPTTTPCVGNQTGGASVTVAGQTAAELQTPEGYTGIYALWNLSLDDDDYPDNPWRFGATTTYPALNTPTQRQAVADYDRDGDGLIDIASVYQLNAIRHDLNGNGQPDATGTYVAYAGAFPGGDLAATGTRMGCAEGCAGYELTANLDFAADGIAVTSTDAYYNFAPIGGIYESTFDGNGHTIANLRMVDTGTRAGLFRGVGPAGIIRNVGLIDANVTGGNGAQGVGILAGLNQGTITASYSEGGTVAVSSNATFDALGGLVGHNLNGAIRASYSTAQISQDGNAVRNGGLVGEMANGSITASYAAGRVSGAGQFARLGGLVGIASGSAVITNSYCDTSVTSTANAANACIGFLSGITLSAPAYNTAQLQGPTGYRGIYANWNVDLDGDGAGDNLWNFGSRTDYPRLIHPDRRTGLDYDDDNDGLIDVSTLLQLNAIRYDLDGNGMIADTSSAVAYGNAFPGRDTATSTFMGCQSGTCAGYELAANLDFDTDGSGSVTSTDEYPNWTPIGPYTSVFDGNGRTITRLTITGATSSAGLFSVLSNGGVIRDVGMLNASVSGGATMAGFGILAGENHGRITASYVSDGTVTLTADGNAGGLVGINTGAAEIRAAYATATIDAGAQTGTNAGGLVGHHRGGAITAAYAAGIVSGGAVTVTGTSTTGTSTIVTATGTTPIPTGIGGFAGRVSGTSTSITAGYCDTDVVGTSTPCIGVQDGGASVTVEGKTTAELQSPTDYTGIYENWNIGLAPGDTDDYPWNFGAASDYPVLHTPEQRAAFVPPPPPPPGPGPTDPGPTDPGTTDPGTTDPGTTDPGTTDPGTTDPGTTDPGTTDPTDPGTTPEPDPPAPSGAVVLEVEELAPYDAAAGHPEVYGEDEYDASVTCKTFGEDPETGGPAGSILAFDLGEYTGDFVLTLSLWDGKRFITYEGQDIDLPELERFGQVVELWVTTDPANTRFRLDIRRYGLISNLLLGYADCRADGP